MIKFHKLVFALTMIIGTLITVSSYSWLSMWMGLEINLLSIIPLLSNSKNIYPSESALKYFITQALASSIFLFAIILSFNFYSFFIDSSLTISMILNSALLTKIGAAPFHAWFPEVLEGLNWSNCLIMLTWQKIAPMIIIFYNCRMTLFFLWVILASTIISGILGLNQISLRKILAYSSINHISWMLASMLNAQNIWFFYFFTYSVITLNIIIIFKQFKIFYLNQLFNSLNFNKKIKFFFILNFLSLGGLPPFLGFFPKWLVINNLIQNNLLLMSFFLIVFTLITLFFYLRITFSTLMITTNESIMLYPTKIDYKIIFLNFITIVGLLICTLIFNLF